MMFIYDSDIIMSISIQQSILDVPYEILEDNLLTLLPFDDLMNLMNIGNVRLIRCCGYQKETIKIQRKR